MDVKEMSIDQLEERKAQIGLELDNPDADLDALEAEVRSIKDEMESRKQAAEKKAELRKAVANGDVGEVIKTKIVEDTIVENRTFGIDTAEYRNAFLKKLMGKELTAEERTGMDSGTSSGGYAIPEQIQNKIITNLIQVAPLVGEVDLLHIPGNVTLLVESTVADAALHTENASISVSEDTLVRIQLSGYELCKTIQISAKLSLMAIDAFEAWITEQLSRKLAELVENYIVNGSGSSQPKGFDKLTWTTSGNTQNAVDWASTAPTVAELETQMGLLNGAYLNNAKWVMSWPTFMTYIHTLRDDKEEKVFERSGHTYHVFGFPVVFSSKCPAGAIYFGDLRETVKANFAQDITIEANTAAGFERNCTVYRGAAIFDCNVVSGRMTKSAASIA